MGVERGAPMTSEAMRRSWWRVALVLLGALGLWIATVYIEIERAAQPTAPAHADAIIVFGAAEYAGRPSPVWKARLDAALELYRAKYAPIVITTGGSARDPRFSEGGVGRQYLLESGVPESDLIAETQASDTSESARRVGTIMRENGWHSCIAVSDSYHLFRIQRMLQAQGLTVYTAARHEKVPLSWHRDVTTKIKETLSYTAWLLHIT